MGGPLHINAFEAEENNQFVNGLATPYKVINKWERGLRLGNKHKNKRKLGKKTEKLMYMKEHMFHVHECIAILIITKK